LLPLAAGENLATSVGVGADPADAFNSFVLIVTPNRRIAGATDQLTLE
jgi:hypothetical protein